MRAPRRVIASLVTSSNFIIGAQVLAHSLRRLGVRTELWLLVTADVLRDNADLLVESGFDRVVHVDTIPNPNPSHVESWVRCGFTKLRVWQLDQLSVEQVLYIDADAVVLSNPEYLFDRLDTVDFAAAPDILPPDNFNAGVLLLKTSSSVFVHLLTQAANLKSYDGGDTGFLNAVYPHWFNSPHEARLPFGCNAQRAMRAFTKRRPEYWGGVDIHILHYSSSPKPWELQDPPPASVTTTPISPHEDPDVIFYKLLRGFQSAPISPSQLLRLHAPPITLSSPALPARFDDGMGGLPVAFGLYSDDDASWLAKFRRSYDRLLAQLPLDQRSIPPFIHQIWLGDIDNAPEEFEAWASTIQIHHPTWTYRLWTDEDVVHLPLRRRDLYDSATTFVQKSDILRWELLYMFGGVYLDCDVETVGSLDALTHAFSFFAGIGNTGFVEVMNSALGCRANHSLARDCLDAMTIPDEERKLDWKELTKSTGPGMLTIQLGLHCNLERMEKERIGVLPSLILYPLPNSMRMLDSRTDKQSFAGPNSFALHHWASSWQSPGQTAHVSASAIDLANLICKIGSGLRTTPRTIPQSLNLTGIQSTICRFLE